MVRRRFRYLIYAMANFGLFIMGMAGAAAGLSVGNLYVPIALVVTALLNLGVGVWALTQ